MVLKGVIWVQNDKTGLNGLESINRIHNDKIDSNGLERSKLGRQYKNQVKWSWKESIGYTMVKLDSNGLQRSQKCCTNDKIGSNGLERSHLGTQW